MAQSMENPLKQAARAIQFAQEVRSYHRRRTERGSRQRAADLLEAQKRLRDAMKPLRSYLGRAPYGPQTHTAQREIARVRKASKALQGERRRIWKMQQPYKPKRKEPS